MIFLQSLTQAELAALLLPQSRATGEHKLTPEEAQKKRVKQAAYRAKQIFHWAYQRHAADWDAMTDLSKELRAWLKENVAIYRPAVRHQSQSFDGTMKFLWNLADSKTIESVIIPAALHEKGGGVYSRNGRRTAAGDAPSTDLHDERWRRLTACISSQVGCAMACKFCLTGIQGLDRHLEVHEIVGQVHELRRQAPITNIVFMGMGEPLHNVDNVAKACTILLDGDGLNFSKRRVTVSTSGIVPAIDKLASIVDVSLAVSLNGSNDDQRTKIMPVNKRWPIDELLKACQRYPLGGGRKITFEYVLLDGINDTLEDAARVVKISRRVRSKINLIPFNEHPGSEFRRPSDAKVEAFHDFLMKRGVTTTVRISRGRDILAACGQLRSIFGTARGSDRHKDWTAAASQ